MATSLKEFSTTAASNTAVGSANVDEGCPPSGINNAIRQFIAYVIDWLMNTDTIASAATTDIGTKTASYLAVSGTTTITALGTPTNKTEYTLKFDGALILTHNGTSLILPAAANVTTRAGEVAKFRHEGSGNWRCVSYPARWAYGDGTSGQVLTSAGAGSLPTWAVASGTYAAKTSGYTVAAADSRGVIDFTTAGATATLTAAATLGSGFTVTIINSASSGDVTIDPNSTETIDGLTTRLLRPGDRATIVCDGSNWKTVRGIYSYDSGAQTVTTGGALTLAHGLGVTPATSEIECTLTNVTNQANWTTGQVMKIPYGGYQNAAESNNFTMQPDATNLNLQYGSTAIAGVNRTTGAIATLTPANWTLRVVVKVVY